jgi:hypothetical protein
MNSRFNGSMGYQRLIKEIKRDVGGGGGPPGPDSVGTSQIINGTITTADIALGTIDISNLSASCIASLSGGGGGLTANSVDSSHIINGSILTIDISDHAITYEKIAANAVTNTRIANGAVTHAKLSSNCVESHNIVDRTILGIDISLGQIGEAHFDASFTTNLTAFAVALVEAGDAIKELSAISRINLIINNLPTSDKHFNYEITFTDANSNVTYYFTSAVGIYPSSSQSILLKIESVLLTTTITIAIDTGSIIVDEHGVQSGASEVDYSTETGTTYLSFEPDGSSNIEIYFKVLND